MSLLDHAGNQSALEAYMLKEANLRRRIERKYRELDLAWSWRLLYTPFSTITSNSGVAFIGLNPGGDGGTPEVAVQTGCAYLDESWGAAPGKSRLQRQVQAMFGSVAKAWGIQDIEGFLRQSLTGNLVPFRSPEWADLKEHETVCLTFGQRLWREIIDIARPRLILTATRRVADCIFRAYDQAPRYKDRRTGWGAVRWSVAQDIAGVPFKKLITVPHLSRFGIFERSRSFERMFQQECRSSCYDA